MKYIRTYAHADSQPLKFFINEADEKITVTCFAAYPAGATVDNAVDFATANVNVDDPAQPFSNDGYTDFTGLPNQSPDQYYRLMYKTMIDVSDMSEDEFCDYSIIDLQTESGDFKRVSARFVDTAVNKVTSSVRQRYLSNAGTNINIKFPFANWADGICSVHAPESQVVEGNITFAENRDGEASDSTTLWMDVMWHVHQTEAATVDADGYVNIPFKLRWNKDDSDCARSTTLKVDDVNGYTPYNRVTTAADGTGTLRVGALGMVSGDQVKVKLNGNLVTNLGVLTATVN